MLLSEARHAFITGGASGLGFGVAEALAARGVPVTLADVDAARLAEHAHDGRFRAVALDTRDRAGWARGKAEAEAALGPVDVLVNNAGIAPNGRPFADMDPDSFDRIVAINLTGVANGVFAFAADMRDRGRGHIVNTSSQAGLTATVTGVGAYAVAKYGVTALSESLRAELAGHGVGVTCLMPGYVRTNLAENTARIGGDLREYAQMPPSELTPLAVGEMVARGIEDNAAYVITHQGTWRSFEKRVEAIRAACRLREPGI